MGSFILMLAAFWTNHKDTCIRIITSISSYVSSLDNVQLVSCLTAKPSYLAKPERKSKWMISRTSFDFEQNVYAGRWLVGKRHIERTVHTKSGNNASTGGRSWGRT